MKTHKKQSVKRVRWQLDEKPSTAASNPWKTLGAEMDGQLEVLKDLHQSNKPITVTNKGGQNALHFASWDPNLTDVVTWLLTLKNPSDQSPLFDIEAQDQDGFTAVHYAASRNHVAALTALKKAGANTKATNKKGSNAMHMAAFEGHVEATTWLINHLVDPETGVTQLINTGNANGHTPFLRAAMGGNNPEVMSQLKKHGAKMNVGDSQWYGALHLAASCRSGGQIEATIAWLIAPNEAPTNGGGFDIESTGGIAPTIRQPLSIFGYHPLKYTPFLLAAANGNLPALKILKKHGANLKAEDFSSKNALHLAAEHGHDLVIKWLLMPNHGPEKGGAGLAIEARDGYNCTPLMVAADALHCSTLNLLLAHGANVTYRAAELAQFALRDPRRPLRHKALQECIPQWLERLADARRKNMMFLQEAQNGWYGSSWSEACQRHLANGAQLNATNKHGDNALILVARFSCEEKTPELIDWLLDWKDVSTQKPMIPIETKGRYGRTAFLRAAEGGMLFSLQKLASRGANVLARDDYGNTATHLIARIEYQSTKKLDWLLSEENNFGLNIEATNQKGLTPFLYAAMHGQKSNLQWLSKHQADTQTVDHHGCNALHLAAAYSHSPETVEWLVRPVEEGGAGLAMESKDRRGMTAALHAAQQNQLPTLKWLVSRGANLDATDHQGHTILHLASSQPHNLAVLSWLNGPERSSYIWIRGWRNMCEALDGAGIAFTGIGMPKDTILQPETQRNILQLLNVQHEKGRVQWEIRWCEESTAHVIECTPFNTRDSANSILTALRKTHQTQMSAIEEGTQKDHASDPQATQSSPQVIQNDANIQIVFNGDTSKVNAGRLFHSLRRTKPLKYSQTYDLAQRGSNSFECSIQ